MINGAYKMRWLVNNDLDLYKQTISDWNKVLELEPEKEVSLQNLQEIKMLLKSCCYF